MKLAPLAPLVLSSAFASPDSKAAKLLKLKAKFPKAAYGYGKMCMSTSSMSMSVGPEPPITPSPTTGAPTTPQPTQEPSSQPSSEPSEPPLRVCGESFINEKVVLTNNLDCEGPVEEVPQQLCAVTLDGPFAEIDCNDYTLSQEATSQAFYGDGPFREGICLRNGAKARNCNVQRFNAGINVKDGAEVVNSNLSSNYFGIVAEIKDATLTIENTDASNNVGIGLYIDVVPGVNINNARLILKGKVTANSNDVEGMYFYLNANGNLEINVESGATITTCENNRSQDITGTVLEGAKVEFSGDVIPVIKTGYCSLAQTPAMLFRPPAKLLVLELDFNFNVNESCLPVSYVMFLYVRPKLKYTCEEEYI